MDHNSQNKDANLYGRRTWNLLHSMSAYFPETPTPEEQQAAKDFLQHFMRNAIDYPDWGERFLKYMDEVEQVDVSGRKGFSEWMCRQHNRVNRERGRVEFDCDYTNLRKRWGPPL